MKYIVSIIVFVLLASTFVERAYSAQAWICAISIACTYRDVRNGLTVGEITSEIRGTGDSIRSESEALMYAKGSASGHCASLPGGRSHGAWINEKCVEVTVPDNDNCR